MSWVEDTLRRLVECESPSGEVAHLDRCRDVLVEEFAAAGVTLEVVPGPAGDHLVGGSDGPVGAGGAVP